MKRTQARHSLHQHKMRSVFFLLLLGALSSITGSSKAEPVPPGARGPGFPLHLEGTLRVEEISTGLYYAYNGVYQTIFLISRRGVILVDAPPALMETPDGSTLLGAIASITSAPITDLIYSHAHKDHIGGAATVQAAFPGVRIHAHPDTLRTLQAAHEENSNDSRPLPNRLVKKKARVRVGNQVLELEDRGTFHEPGDLFIYAPRQKVLMAVDVVLPGWVPFVNFALTDDVRGFVNAHGEILTYDFDVFVGGHLTRLGTRMDVVASQEYVFAVIDAAALALQTIEFGAGASPEQAENIATLFDFFLEDVTTLCESLVVPEWSFLGGADTATKGNCFAAQNFLRLD